MAISTTFQYLPGPSGLGSFAWNSEPRRDGTVDAPTIATWMIPTGAIPDAALADAALPGHLAQVAAYASQRRAEREVAAANAALLARCEAEGVAAHIRLGALPRGGRSHNYRDDRDEPGVSVYAGWTLPDGTAILDLRGMDQVSSYCITTEGRPARVVTGTPARSAEGRA
jgi:hypothetical protein